MNEEIINQLAMYNKGFFDSKIDVIGAYKLNKPIVLKEELKIKDTWYKYGYLDGFTHYKKLIDNNSDSYLTEDTNKIMKKNFGDRVLKTI